MTRRRRRARVARGPGAKKTRGPYGPRGCLARLRRGRPPAAPEISALELQVPDCTSQMPDPKPDSECQILARIPCLTPFRDPCERRPNGDSPLTTPEVPEDMRPPYLGMTTCVIEAEGALQDDTIPG